MGRNPLWLNFSNPTILNVNQNKSWDDDPALSDLVVVSELNADSKDSWIYLLITATKFPNGLSIRRFVPAYHPVRHPSPLFSPSCMKNLTLPRSISTGTTSPSSRNRRPLTGTGS